MLRILQVDDARLVRRTLRGQRDAFTTLVERNLELVFAVAYGIVANRADAEDVTQDTFLAAFSKLPSLREPAKFRAWILTITRNRSSDTIVKRRREFPIDQGIAAPSVETEGLADVELVVFPADDLRGVVLDPSGSPLPDVMVSPNGAPMNGDIVHVDSRWMDLSTGSFCTHKVVRTSRL